MGKKVVFPVVIKEVEMDIKLELFQIKTTFQSGNLVKRTKFSGT